MTKSIGQQFPSTATTEYDSLNFIVNQLISNLSTCTLAQVTATTRTGLLERVGFVDVQPLVHLINGNKDIMPNARLSNLPVFRLQSGNNAVIIDPEVGDIGIVVFASRDISSVKVNAIADKNKAASQPGSFRRYSLSDGLYIGGVLNTTPTQYIRYNNTDGITIHSPVKITINAPEVVVQGTTKVTVTSPDVAIVASTKMTINAPTLGITANTTFTGTVTANGKVIDERHTHSGVQSGQGTTGPVS